MTNIFVRVTNKSVEAQDVVSFTLQAIDGGALPPFSAGAHIDVRVADAIERQYSLCNDPAESHRYQIAVLREPASRGGSVAMHERVAIGDLLTISEPKNHFPLMPARRTLLFAGGIGVTPILCMAERLAQVGADFEMHYCTCSIERTAFRSRIEQSVFAHQVHFHFDSGAPGQKLNAQALLAKPLPDTFLYVCGPAGFIEHVVDTAKAASWADQQIHREYFGAKPHDTGQDGAFEVELASSGKVFLIPADRTIVEVLADHDIDIPTSCEQGVCGTCITRLLGGLPEHRDVYLTDDERARNDQFTPCCSRARSARLVLDL